MPGRSPCGDPRRAENTFLHVALRQGTGYGVAHSRKAEILPWLREFDVMISRPDVQPKKHIPWDWLPQDWTADPRFYQADKWDENELMTAGGVGEEYRKVTEQFDALLAKHGYIREDGYYRAEKPNHDTIFGEYHRWSYGTAPARRPRR